ncbi:PREDICTED: popeye domain-containing protein 2 isoform X3 [Pseudopodoces humilis]|uniref:popeye domain-containing protein 2 isoform X3 n=1 Tax=Pseudopodoces humilis TaxID=181119 RepID=UPI0006B6CFE2|nr:PREDICTED: popeye domain-containing protein 2 isoform X3 [Pseudopodoces humilis]
MTIHFERRTAGEGGEWGRMSANSPSWDQVILQPPVCDAWKEIMEEAAYQLASCIVLLGYMGGSGIFGSLYIFGLLAPGYFCYALWGWLSACGLDIFIWNMLLVLACLLQLAHLAYRLRRNTIPEEFDLLYKTMYLPLQVPLEVYKEIVKCCEEQVQSLVRDQNYAVEGKTPIDRLSLLLSGRIRVCQDGQFLHYVFPYQFLDSPEWESLRPSEEGTFQVTLTAETDCSYITWPRKKLYLLLRKDRYIARLFSSHLGYDISEKLYSLNEKLFAKFGLRFDIRLPSLYHVLGPASSEGELEDCEDHHHSRHHRHRRLHAPGHPGPTVTCWPLKTISRVLTLSAKDEPLWLPLRPPNSREQQAVLIPKPLQGSRCSHRFLTRDTL